MYTVMLISYLCVHLAISDPVHGGLREPVQDGNFILGDAIVGVSSDRAHDVRTGARLDDSAAFTAGQMAPRFPNSDVRDHRLRNTESDRDLTLEGAISEQLVNLTDLIDGQCCEILNVHSVSSAGRHASFGESVNDVVLLGSREQMGRIHAASNVAVVADLKANRRPNMPLERDDVGATLLRSKAERAIAITEEGGRPDPARAETGDTLNLFFDDFRPEAGAIGFWGGYNAHVSTSVSTTGVGLPRATTNRAGASSYLNFTMPSGEMTMKVEAR